MQDHCSPPSSLVHRFIVSPHIYTVVDQGRVSILTCCVTTTSPLRRPVADLYHGWFGSMEGLGAAQIALRSGQRTLSAKKRNGTQASDHQKPQIRTYD